MPVGWHHQGTWCFCPCWFLDSSGNKVTIMSWDFLNFSNRRLSTILWSTIWIWGGRRASSTIHIIKKVICQKWDLPRFWACGRKRGSPKSTKLNDLQNYLVILYISSKWCDQIVKTDQLSHMKISWIIHKSFASFFCRWFSLIFGIVAKWEQMPFFSTCKSTSKHWDDCFNHVNTRENSDRNKEWQESKEYY